MQNSIAPATARMAGELAARLKFLIEQKQAQDEMQQSQQSELIQSLAILLKFLQHTAENVLLHGPTVAYGYQKRREPTAHGATTLNGVAWSTNLESEEEMPTELMKMIEEYLTLNGVLELPGLGAQQHTLTQTHSTLQSHGQERCQQYQQGQCSATARPTWYSCPGRASLRRRMPSSSWRV